MTAHWHSLQSKSFSEAYYTEHRDAGLDYLVCGDWQEQYGRWIVESLNWGGKKVLDVGCAAGAILRGMQAAGADTQGVDLCEYMIGLHREKWPDTANRVHTCDCVNLHLFPRHSFHGIHSAQVAEHWRPDLVPSILRELHRVTKPGGLFFCCLDTAELGERTGRDLASEDPTHVCIRPLAWWREQLSSAGWIDCRARHEPAMQEHPESFLRRYDWDWWIVERA